MKQGGNKNKISTQIVSLARKKLTPYLVKKIIVGPTESKTVDIFKRAAGADVTNYTHEVDNYALQHSLKGHGHDELPITPNDFAKIPGILKNPDTIEYSGKTNEKLDAIKYTKQYNRIIYHYIEELRTGRKTLNMTTMYKTKTPSGASTA